MSNQMQDKPSFKDDGTQTAAIEWLYAHETGKFKVVVLVGVLCWSRLSLRDG